MFPNIGRTLKYLYCPCVYVSLRFVPEEEEEKSLGFNIELPRGVGMIGMVWIVWIVWMVGLVKWFG